MTDSFLDIIRRELGNSDYAGDEHGGATGHNGSGLPRGAPGTFMFSTGIECSYPTIENGRLRRDQMAECGHYDRWREDLGLVRDLGLKVLRYGLPYHRINPSRGVYHWDFADQVMAEIKRLELTPILDLLHFGVPDWIGNFQNPELPVVFAHYADAVAARYPWVRFYTPVNEIFAAARISAKDGQWNEQLKTDRGFVTAVMHLSAASIMATHAIARRRPDCIIVQSESAEYWHEMKVTQSDAIRMANKSRFLPLDLLYAFQPDAEMYQYLLDNGMSREQFTWFMAGEPPGYQIVGIDYYGRNEHMVKPDGTSCPTEDVFGWYQIAHEYHLRYRKPLMHTETNVFDPEFAPTWLWKQWLNILRMRRDGVPVLGFTWYSLTDQIDWDVNLAQKNDRVNACGLYDLNRNPRPVAHDFRKLLEEFGQITMVPQGELFAVTERPATLKTDV
jgi:beta-glucosidase/6-phospho-beta-glucosidase/beta-galactosidase